MPGECERVDARFGHVYGDMAAALRSVREKQHPRGQGFADFRQRRDGARDVGGGGDRDQLRLRLYALCDLFGGDVSVRQRADVVGDDARFFQKFEGAQDGIVLHAGGDDVVAGRKQAEDGDVERFRAVFREYRPFEAVAAEIFGERVSAIEHGGSAGEGEFVPAPSGVGAQLRRGGDGGNDAIGLASARGGIVEIDHESHLFLCGFIKYSIPPRRSV